MRNIGSWLRWPDRSSGAPLKEVQIVNSPKYIIKEKLGEGGFGSVYVGESTDASNVKVAVKFVRRHSKGADGEDLDEWEAYKDLQGIDGVPRVHYYGQQGDYNILIMDKLGSSLRDLQKKTPEKISEEMLKHIAVQAILVLKEVHSTGYVHGDIKPNNLLLGPPGTSEGNLLFLVDFGLATRWKDNSGEHVAYDQHPHNLRGSIEYASVHTHLGRRGSRRDDLESLAYTLISLHRSLPWQRYEGENIWFPVCKEKMSTSPASLCCSLPQPFREFLEYVVKLRFDETPNYEECVSLFEGTGDPKRLISMAGAQQYARTGKSHTQWISVYDRRQPMIQRYHNDVTDKSLAYFIEKGKEENLLISTVASCNNLWTLILDAGTHFEEQVYDPLCNLLDKKWIEEQWGRKYYITAIGGATDGSYFVVMSKGALYTHQTYLVRGSFPLKDIMEYWDKQYHITSMATAGNEWAVVMSRGAGFLHQVVERDFVYPDEGIHWRLDSGFQITATAATMEQIVFVFSKRKPLPPGQGYTNQKKEEGEQNERQKIDLSSQFPNKNIRGNWKADFYITSLCYGRTVL